MHLQLSQWVSCPVARSSYICILIQSSLPFVDFCWEVNWLYTCWKLILDFVVSVMLYPCILCVALLMDMFVLCVARLAVFVNCLVKQFVIWLGMVVKCNGSV